MLRHLFSSGPQSVLYVCATTLFYFNLCPHTLIFVQYVQLCKIVHVLQDCLCEPLVLMYGSGWCKRVLLSKGKPGSYYQAVHVNSWTGSKSRCVIFSYFVFFVCSDFGEREVGWTLQIQSCHHLSTWSLKCTQLLLQQYLPTFITSIDLEKYHYHLKSGSYQIFNDSEGVCRL